ncbi:MAG: PEP-CTERM sorting domain-containing protein [Pseudomonadota bacterium]
MCPARRRSLPSCLTLPLALLLAGGSLPARAEAVVALVDRVSENNVMYKGPYDPDYTYVGTTVPVTALTGESTLELVGSDTHTGSSFGYEFWTYTVGWSQSQTFSILGQTSALTQIQAQGATNVSVSDLLQCHVIEEVGCSQHWATITGLNSQSLTFTVSEATDYSISGAISGGEAVFLQVWVESDSKFHSIEHFFGGDKTFSLTDTLDPGLYRVINSLDSFEADTAPWSQNATWSYTLTFPSAVPEAETWAMLLAGLGLLGLRARRRAK